MPKTLRGIIVAEEQIVELSMLCGSDDDMAKQATETSNRIRGLTTQIHPALKRFIGWHLDQVAMAQLLAKSPPPAALRRTGQPRVGTLLRKHAPLAWKGWAKEIIPALDAQTLVVSGTDAELPAPGSMPRWRRLSKSIRCT